MVSRGLDYSKKEYYRYCENYGNSTPWEFLKKLTCDIVTIKRNINKIYGWSRLYQQEILYWHFQQYSLIETNSTLYLKMAKFKYYGWTTLFSSPGRGYELPLRENKDTSWR